MAKFEIAEKITGINEGGYANNKADRGGETFAGIARNFWPKWEGWKYIDKYKEDYKKAATKLTLSAWINASAKVPTEPVKALIVNFYKKNFWDVNQLDKIKDQQVANSVYDFGVNSGKGRAVQFLEEIFDVKKDGIIDPVVIEKVNSADPKIVLHKYNAKREAYYRAIAKGSQAQFLPSWLSRLKPYIAVIFFLFISACGLRKTNVDKDKTVVETKTEIKSKKDIDSAAFNQEENFKTEKSDVSVDKENLTTETKIKETFNTDGTLKSRTTSTKTSAKKDKSKGQKIQSETKTKVDLSAFEDHSELTDIRESDSTKNITSKHVEADKSFVANVGGWGVVITCFIVVVLAIFFFYYLKSKKN